MKGFLLMLVCTVFTALGQLFFKIGANNLSLETILSNYALFLGFFFYAIGAVLMILALKHGDLNALYPVVSLTFIWVMLISRFFFGEMISTVKMMGIGVIMLGVIVLSRK